jgi:hypothetical protein
VRSDKAYCEEVRRQVLTNELISQRAAMKKYDLGWHTLKKILAHAEPFGYRQSKAGCEHYKREITLRAAK